MGEFFTAIWDSMFAIGTLIFSGVVAWSAVANNRLNKRMVKAELDPALSVYLEPHPRAFKRFEVVVRNVGRGVAYNVSFEIEDQEGASGTIGQNLREIGVVRTGLPFFPSGQEIRYLTGNYQGLEASTINVNVQYFREPSSKAKNVITASFPLDVRPYAGVHKVGIEPEQASAASLRNIANTLNRMTTTKPLRVRAERRYLVSDALDRWRVRWFGDAVINSGYSPLRYFMGQLRKLVSQAFSR